MNGSVLCPDCGRRRSLRVGDCQDTGNCIDYLKAQLSQAQAEILLLRACVEAADEMKRRWQEVRCYPEGSVGFEEAADATGVFDAARAKLTPACIHILNTLDHCTRCGARPNDKLKGP